MIERELPATSAEPEPVQRRGLVREEKDPLRTGFWGHRRRDSGLGAFQNEWRPPVVPPDPSPPIGDRPVARCLR